MLKKVVTTIVFTFGFLFHPVLATADEINDVINDVATKLAQQLPMENKFVAKQPTFQFTVLRHRGWVLIT